MGTQGHISGQKLVKLKEENTERNYYCNNKASSANWIHIRQIVSFRSSSLHLKNLLIENVQILCSFTVLLFSH